MSAEERFLKLASQLDWSVNKTKDPKLYGGYWVHALNDKGLEKYRVILGPDEVIKFTKNKKMGFLLHMFGTYKENRAGRLLLAYAKLAVL